VNYANLSFRIISIYWWPLCISQACDWQDITSWLHYPPPNTKMKQKTYLQQLQLFMFISKEI